MSEKILEVLILGEYFGFSPEKIMYVTYNHLIKLSLLFTREVKIIFSYFSQTW